LYLSIIFIILSCSVLAFEQLSAIDKNQKNYAVIDRLGVPGHRQASLIRRELSTVFLIPLLFPLLLTVLLITGAQFFFGEAILQQGLVPLKAKCCRNLLTTFFFGKKTGGIASFL